MQTIRITKPEMEAFASASGDVNPVHLDDQSATSRRFEAPVVYGVLGVLAALSALKARPGLVLHRLDASFSRPLFVGSRYRLEVREEGALHAMIVISDSSLQAFTVRAWFEEATKTPRCVIKEPSRLKEPLEPSIAELESGLLATGPYGASSEPTRWLEERFGLPPRGVDGYAMHGLLCTSYLIGMRLPGLGSLLSRLQLALPQAKREQSESTPQFTGSLTYRASVVEIEAHLHDATVAGVLDHGDRRVAIFTCQTRLAPATAAIDHRLERYLAISDRLEGRVAVVVGASRGLGAALAKGLASQGCHVYACSRSGGVLECAPSWSGSIEHVHGDSSDPEFCRELLERITSCWGGVDLLLCCAAPRLSAIGFGTYSISRFNDFLQRSIELVTVPMATFLEAVQARRGGCLFVSSTAISTLPPEWGHYVSAKAAGEALAVWSARYFPDVEMVVGRVPRLGREQHGSNGDMMAPEEAAARLVDRLAERVRPGVHLVEW